MQKSDLLWSHTQIQTQIQTQTSFLTSLHQSPKKQRQLVHHTRRLNPISEMETSSRNLWYQEKVMSYWKNQNDCMEKARGAIMVLAVYTLFIFPRMAGNFKRTVEGRTLDSSEELAYFYFKMSSSFTSIASLLMTLLLLTGFLVKSRFCTGLLSITFLVTLLSMIPGYSSSLYLVTPSQLHERLYLSHCGLLITAAAGALLCVFQAICFLTWLSVREKIE